MSQIHALSDGQVDQELRKMTAFIRQEANEKAREIELKADEEFAIEKSKLVRQETDAIETAYEKRFKQAAMAQQIARSTVSNKSRLRVLAARQELLDSIFDDAAKRLARLAAEDTEGYARALKGLLLEGFYAMMEPTLQVRARKADYDAVRKAIDEAAAEYKEKTGKEVKATIDEENPVPEGSAGGLIVIGGGGKIDIDNTFEARLTLLQQNALPAVRETLFGKNPNRKFYD